MLNYCEYECYTNVGARQICGTPYAIKPTVDEESCEEPIEQRSSARGRALWGEIAGIPANTYMGDRRGLGQAMPTEASATFKCAASDAADRSQMGAVGRGHFLPTAKVSRPCTRSLHAGGPVGVSIGKQNACRIESAPLAEMPG